MSAVNNLRFRPLFVGARLPLLVTPASTAARDLPASVQANKGRIDTWLTEHGAILFRGFAVPSTEMFSRSIDVLTHSRLDYTYRSTPRITVGDRIFTATIYPAALEIPPHQENAYQRDWPMRAAFYCKVKAETGGETPLIDMRRVSARCGEQLLDAFEQRGVKYIRHYRPGIDLSWQDVFQTEDKTVVAEVCDRQGIQHEWLGPDLLRTEQICQGTACHPATGERLFFNQAHLFHVSSQGPEIARSMVDMFGWDRLPRHASFGDGGEIPAADMDAIRTACEAEKVVFPWQTGDVLLLDNMFVGHARKAFTGQREVLAILADPFSRWSLDHTALAG